MKKRFFWTGIITVSEKNLERTYDRPLLCMLSLPCLNKSPAFKRSQRSYKKEKQTSDVLTDLCILEESDNILRGMVEQRLNTINYTLRHKLINSKRCHSNLASVMEYTFIPKLIAFQLGWKALFNMSVEFWVWNDKRIAERLALCRF